MWSGSGLVYLVSGCFLLVFSAFNSSASADNNEQRSKILLKYFSNSFRKCFCLKDIIDWPGGLQSGSRHHTWSDLVPGHVQLESRGRDGVNDRSYYNIITSNVECGSRRMILLSLSNWIGNI